MGRNRKDGKLLQALRRPLGDSIKRRVAVQKSKFSTEAGPSSYHIRIEENMQHKDEAKETRSDSESPIIDARVGRGFLVPGAATRFAEKGNSMKDSDVNLVCYAIDSCKRSLGFSSIDRVGDEKDKHG